MTLATIFKEWGIGKTVLVFLALGVVFLVVYAAWYMKSLFKGPDYSDLPDCYPFKSRTAEKQYHEYCRMRAREWPAPSETRYIQTSFGRTFVRICGPENAPALVLLPSASSSSLIWLPNIQGLARNFRIYALDNIYDVGLSVNTRPLAGADDLAEWLDELFSALKLGNQIHLMGLSLGGWLASQYALRRPERLCGVVLAAPVATVLPLPGEWAWRAILGVLPPRKFFMKRFLVNWMCRGLVKKGDAYSRSMLENWINDALIAMKCFKFRMPVTPTVLTDEELGSLKVPVLFLVGEHEVIYPAAKAVKRIKTVAPSIACEIINDASHDLTVAQTETVNNLATSFLLGVDARTS